MKKSKKIQSETLRKTVKTSRNTILQKQLNRLGKVGGVKDARFGIRDKTTSEQEKNLRRHIVERLRNLDKLQLEHDDEDPLVKAAFGGHDKEKYKKLRMDDKSDGGIQANVVEEEFFSRGSNSENFRDVLAEKIAASKLQKLKRVEENEEQRDRLKAANTEWSQNIRFMLSGVSIKSTKCTSQKVEENRNNFLRLLDTLSSDRRVAPVGAPTPPSDPASQEKQLLRLQSILDDASSKSPTDDAIKETESAKLPTDSRKSVGHLLRVLLRMPEYRSDAAAFVANQLNVAEFRGLKQVIHNLWLAQILLEYCEQRCAEDRQSRVQLDLHASGTGAYCPELIRVLVSMLQLMIPNIDQGSVRPLLARTTNGTVQGNETAAYHPLDIGLTDPKVKLNRDELPGIRLACVNRLIHLCSQAHTLYAQLLPSIVCSYLFAPMYTALEQLNYSSYPTELAERIRVLLDAIHTSAQQPTPQSLQTNTRLAVLSTEQANDARTMKKLGLLPQLEPRFDERIDARRSKKVDARRLVQRQLAREKRGVMREMRRDSQFLAAHQLKVVKAGDEERNKKTQAILSSLRSIED